MEIDIARNQADADCNGRAQTGEAKLANLRDRKGYAERLAQRHAPADASEHIVLGGGCQLRFWGTAAIGASWS